MDVVWLVGGCWLAGEWMLVGGWVGHEGFVTELASISISTPLFYSHPTTHTLFTSPPPPLSVSSLPLPLYLSLPFSRSDLLYLLPTLTTSNALPSLASRAASPPLRGTKPLTIYRKPQANPKTPNPNPKPKETLNGGPQEANYPQHFHEKFPTTL